MKSLLFFLLLFALAGPVPAEEFLPVDQAFQLTVEREGDRLDLHWEIADDYYLYRDRHQLNALDGAGVGEATLSPGAVEKYDVTFDQVMPVYYGEMSASYAVTADDGRIEVVYQGCADDGLCYPPQKRYFDLQGVALERPAAASGGGSGLSLSNETEAATPLAGDSGLASLTLASALVFALLGGLILNLMPCVFPVLSLKALHLAQHGGDGERLALHGWAYTAGVVLSFIVVAAVFLGLRQFGTWVGWGFQLQSPAFVAALVVLFFVMTLAMAGYIEVGTRWMGLGQSLTTRAGPTGSFFTGVLATLVATPCTAPFMGAAIGFALLQPAGLGLSIFAVMGLGLALPILVFSYLPALARRLPAPGPWMTRFRQLMAFPLFATVLWLLWVLVELRGPTMVLRVGLGLMLLVVVIWPALAERPQAGAVGRWGRRSLRLLALGLALALVFTPPRQDDLWQPYDAAVLEDHRNRGQAVFLNVTAAWCITCKANERVALSGEAFDSLVERSGVRLMRADWTRPSPVVDALLERFDRDGVPLYVHFPAEGAPEVLPQILTPGLVRRTLDSG